MTVILLITNYELFNKQKHKLQTKHGKMLTSTYPFQETDVHRGLY